MSSVRILPITTTAFLLALAAMGGIARAEDPEPRNQSRDQSKQSKQQVEFGIDVARIGLWKEAMYRWEKAVELDPKNASARNNLAIAYEQTGEFDQANAEYEKALEIEPNNTYIRQNYELFREAYERKKRTDRRSSSN